MDYNYEEEIDLKDLILYVLKKWRQILICMLIGLLIGVVFSFIKMKNQGPEAVLREINDADQSEINLYEVQQYDDYVRIYKQLIQKHNDSVLLNLDANSVYVGNLSYSITAENSDINYVGSNLSGVLERDNNLDSIAESVDYSAEQLREIITISYSNPTSLMDNKNTTVVTSGDNKTGFVNVKVYGADKDIVQTIVDKVKTIMSNAIRSINGNDVDIILTQDSIKSGFDEDLMKLQRQDADNRGSILTSLTNAETKLSDIEKKYYSYYYDYEEAFENQKLGFSKKWPVIFAVLFAFAMAFWYLMQYVFDGCVKNENELVNRYGLKLLSTIEFDKKIYKGIDKIIHDFDKVVINDSEYLKSVIKSFGDRKMIVCSDNEQIKEMFASLDKKIKLFNTLDVDEKAINELNKCDGVILTSKVGSTRYSQIERQIDIVKRNNKEIFGVISIR